MTSSPTRTDGPKLSISTMISTSCVMLENLHEFNPLGTANECGCFPDYMQQAGGSALQIPSGCDPTANALTFESEASPFSQESILKADRLSDVPSLYTPLLTQTECATDMTKATFGTEGVNTTASVNEKLFYPLTSLEQNSTAQPRLEDTYTHSSGESGRFENGQEIRYKIHNVDKDGVLTDSMYPKDAPCVRWNATNTMQEHFDMTASFRQTADWPDITGQPVPSLDSNASKDGSWAMNICARPSCIYDDVSGTSRQSCFMTSAIGENHGGGHVQFPVMESQESDYVSASQQWLTTYSSPPREFETSMFSNVSSETNTESGSYLASGPTAMSDSRLHDGPFKAQQLNTDFQHIASPVDETEKSRAQNFLMDEPCSQGVSKDATNNEFPFPNSHLQQFNGNDNHASEIAYDIKTPEKSPERCLSSSFKLALAKDEEDNGNSVPDSLVGFESDEGSTGCNTKPRQMSTTLKQTTWTTESIQNELEMLEERRKKMAGPVNSAQERLEKYKFETVSKSKGSSLVDVDYMICSGATVAGFKPRAIIRKRSKVNIASDTKDQGYWQKRRKNNDSARKSRELKKEKEKNFYRRALELEYENIYLHECLALAEAELAAVGRRIPAPPMNSSGLY